MLSKMSKEELETMSYTDLAEMILKEEKKQLNTPTLFKKICELLELTDEEYQSQIGDFYTSLTTDKRFVILDNACFDLRDKHAFTADFQDDEEDEDIDEEEIENEDDMEDLGEDDDIDSEDDIDNLDDTIDDDLDDLTILDEDEIEE